MTVNWKVNTIEAATDPVGWVVTLHYDAVLTDGETSARNYGTVSMPTQDDTVEMTDLVGMGEEAAKEHCVHWVKEQLGEEQVTEIEAGLAAQVEALKNPTVVSLFAAE